MGRQAYFARFALGRSPWELPEPLLRTANSHTPNAQSDHASNNSEEQQYDIRGHPVNPKSRNASRRLRKAENEILSAVGVLVGAYGRPPRLRNDSSVARKVAKHIESENNTGVFVHVLDAAFMSSSCWWIRALKLRFQTFRNYLKVPILDIIRIERRHYGFVGFFLPGVPACIAAVLIDTAMKRMYLSFDEWLTKKTALIENPRYYRWLSVLKTYHPYVFRAATLLITFPLDVFSILQMLGLVSAWPLLPHVRSFIPFSKSSPIQLPQIPHQLSMTNLLGLGKSILLSPFSLYYLRDSVINNIPDRINSFFSRTIPVPDNPDAISFVAVNREGMRNNMIPRLQPCLRQDPMVPLRLSLLKKISEMYTWGHDWIKWASSALSFAHGNSKHMLEKSGESAHPNHETESMFAADSVDDNQNQLHARQAARGQRTHTNSRSDLTTTQSSTAPTIASLSDANERRTNAVLAPSPPSESSASTILVDAQRESSDNTEMHSQSRVSTFSLPSGFQHPLNSTSLRRSSSVSSFASSSTHSPSYGASRNPIRLSSITGTPEGIMTLEVEVLQTQEIADSLAIGVRASDRPVNNQEHMLAHGAEVRAADPGTLNYEAFPDSENDEVSLIKQHVTILSAAPAVTLNLRLTEVLTSFFTAPIEAACARCIAISFFASAMVPSVPSMIANVYPIVGAFGGQGFPNALSYIARSWLCDGLEGALEYATWQLTTTLVFWIGRGVYGWGSL